MLHRLLFALAVFTSLATAAPFDLWLEQTNSTNKRKVDVVLTKPSSGGTNWVVAINRNTGAPLYLRYLPSDATPNPPVVIGMRARTLASGSGAPDLPPPPPRAGLAEEDGGTSGCGLPGLELFALLALAYARGRRPSA